MMDNVEIVARAMCAADGKDPEPLQMMSPEDVARGYEAYSGGYLEYSTRARQFLAATHALDSIRMRV